MLGQVLVVALLAALGPNADLESVRVEGAAAGTGPDAVMAAVENAATAIVIDALESATGTTDFSLFKPILDHSRQYIRSYEVLQQHSSDGATRVEIEARVRRRQLRRDIADLVLSRVERRPKVLVLVTAPEAEEPLAAELCDSARTSLVKRLEKDEYDTMILDDLLELLPEEEAQARRAVDAQEAAELARRSLADIAVVGEVSWDAAAITPQSSVSRNHVELTLRVARAGAGDSADMVKAERVNHSAIPAEGIKSALAEACEELADDLSVSVALASAHVRASSDVVVEVRDLGRASRLGEIAQALQGLWGVEKVEELVGTEKLGRLRVEYAGPLAPLVDRLMSSAYSDFSLNARRAVAREVLVEVAPSQ